MGKTSQQGWFPNPPDYRGGGLQREHDVQCFGVDTAFGSLPHSKVMRSMELFVREVMPAFK